MFDLPAPVARFQAVALRDAPATIDTLTIETSAAMRRPGTPTIPLRIRMSHRLGYEFVHDIRIGVRRLAFRFGLDAYVGGRGVVKIGRSANAGPEVDQGALIAMWGEALCFPTAWSGRSDVRWQAVDPATADLIVPGPEGALAIRVSFDSDTGYPSSCEADRHKGSGPKVHWRGDLSEWWRTNDGLLTPGRFSVRWADEAHPWLEIRTESATVDRPIDDAIRLAREALSRVTANQRSPLAGAAGTSVIGASAPPRESKARLNDVDHP